MTGGIHVEDQASYKSGAPMGKEMMWPFFVMAPNYVAKAFQALDNPVEKYRTYRFDIYGNAGNIDISPTFMETFSTFSTC